MPRKKVLVVDDSAFMRKMIGDMINSDDELEIVGKAGNGQEALEKIRELQPDVVVMDIEMPVLDGLSTLSRIMESQALPVIIFSSLSQKGTEQTLKALQLGAVDFIAKPSGQISLDVLSVKEELIKKLKVAANTSRKLPVYQSLHEPVVKAKKSLPDQDRKLNKLVVIAASTGGPKALHQVIPRFPAGIDAAILVVQHMPPGFTRSLAERLDSLSELRVKEAEHGEKVLPACVYIAPGDYHLKAKSRLKGTENELYIELDQSKPRGGLRPAADIMLKSVAKQFWSHIVCVIMTGMGNDGAAALPCIKEKKGRIIAEHQSTCVVYGMPKAAVETGLVDKIVPLSEITEEVLSML
ncbi:protein-glutamate methylesterase/protein-glutamine glutaminase [Syntrophomonas wolfei]|uniref:Protein-glutamate methylesterase/protein-glutamine glutaminase 1 n=1 Tax=Syntrophomonas wolfei subsp. wolfei (strain DSM 2245B / Goettingen) TaxID=335541 RepID=CHEB1_SYNWW|nr:chemotaxis response regulator protein-glutamate methylesterase [Syntrophomonas wolfei]Q0AYL3.1 RecName: Full=Protein-glutamate methylesterase/protein-glutamine glutaminase 1 [Syntrophomonas wolfei subsp. wolfei str. Goettingen G311]ABI68191.1 Protein-glutamate methylesterase [Syntrophomonas wolfei subsp. wolfei str. Goettingen G311]